MEEIVPCTQVPIHLSSAVLPASVSGMEKDVNIALDVVSPGVEDTKESVSTRSRFRQRILGALVRTDASWQFPATVCVQGWTVMTMNIADWRQCVDRRSKCKLLFDLIKEQAGYESAFLWNDGRVAANNKGDALEEKGISEDQSATASNHSTEANVEERAKLDIEGSAPPPELSDETEITDAAAVHADDHHQDASRQGACTFRSAGCH